MILPKWLAVVQSPSLFIVLNAEPYWSFNVQVDVVLPCYVIHNYIIGVDHLDSIIEEVNEEMHRNPSQSQRVHQPQREVQEENREWVNKRMRLVNPFGDIMFLGGIDKFFVCDCIP